MANNELHDDDKTRTFVTLAKGTTVSHYKIISKIGAGGMGEVYLAEDMKLKRKVALKFLPSHFVSDDNLKGRFTREAQATAALKHPNIVTIYEVSEYQGRPFFAMELVEGQSLRELSKGKGLSLDKIIELAIQICDGLDAAHEKKVIHRDIKSSNIVIDAYGRPKILDFGLATIQSAEHLTKTGSTLGTVGYMSPEQAKGEVVDHRTDIWSLGVVLYEMFTGRLPFKRDHEQATIYAILNEEPEPLGSIRSGIPRYFEQIILSALEKDRCRRYQSMQELLQDLQALTVSPTAAPKQEKSIVVLPFENMSPDPDQEYFSDGMTEEIITDLSQIHDLLVISRSSAMTFKGTKKKIGEIAKEVNVRYVLEGSVRKAGNNLRITAQLIDAANDAHLWAEKYSGKLDDVFEIQEKVSRSIVDALEVKLNPKEDKKIAKRPIDDIQAYECYLKAKREILLFTEDGLQKALQYIQNGLDIIGENTALYSGMGYVYLQYVNLGLKQEEYLKKAEELANKAFRLNPDAPEAHLVLALIKFIKGNQGNLRQVILHLKQALDADSNNYDALFWLIVVYGNTGQTFSAFQLCNKLSMIDPLNPISPSMFGWIYAYEGKYDLAIEYWSKGYKMLSNIPPVWDFHYSRYLAYNKQLKDAFSIIDKIEINTCRDIWDQLSLFMKYALKSERKKVKQLVTKNFLDTVKRNLEHSTYIASFYSLLNEKEKALNWLENAVNLGFINYPFLNEYDLFLENIRGEERFKKLIKRVKREWEDFEV